MHSGFSGKCCRRERLLFPQRRPDRDNRCPGALLIPDTFHYTLHLPEKTGISANSRAAPDCLESLNSYFSGVLSTSGGGV